MNGTSFNVEVPLFLKARMPKGLDDFLKQATFFSQRPILHNNMDLSFHTISKIWYRKLLNGFFFLMERPPQPLSFLTKNIHVAFYELFSKNSGSVEFMARESDFCRF